MVNASFTRWFLEVTPPEKGESNGATVTAAGNLRFVFIWINFGGAFHSDSKSLTKKHGTQPKSGCVTYIYIWHDVAIYVTCCCFFYRSFTTFPQNFPTFLHEFRNWDPVCWGWGTSVRSTAPNGTAPCKGHNMPHQRLPLQEHKAPMESVA